MRDQVGLMITEGVAAGIEEGTGEAVTAAEDMAAAVTQAGEAQIDAPTIGTFGPDTFTGVVETLMQTEPVLTDYIADLMERLLLMVAGTARQFRLVGRELMNGVASGILAGRSGVINAVRQALERPLRRPERQWISTARLVKWQIWLARRWARGLRSGSLRG